MAEASPSGEPSTTPPPTKSSKGYTTLKYGLLVAFAPVTVPYFVAKAGVNFALYPVRVAYRTGARTLASLSEG